MSATSMPSAEELDESERLLVELAGGGHQFSSDPVLRVLASARAPASSDELVAPIAFAELAAATATVDATAVNDLVPDPHAASGLSRIRLVGRALAAKAALIVGVGVLGVAGAGAATGAIMASQQQSDPSTTTVVPGSTNTLAPADTATTIPAGTTVAPPLTTSTPTTAPGALGTARTRIPEVTPGNPPQERPGGSQPKGSTAPTTSAPLREETNGPLPASAAASERDAAPGSTGAVNGNGLHAGGTPAPGSNGLSRRHPNPAGKAADGDPGAVNGNGAARSGKPAAATP